MLGWWLAFAQGGLAPSRDSTFSRRTHHYPQSLPSWLSDHEAQKEALGRLNRADSAAQNLETLPPFPDPCQVPGRHRLPLAFDLPREAVRISVRPPGGCHPLWLLPTRCPCQLSALCEPGVPSRAFPCHSSYPTVPGERLRRRVGPPTPSTLAPSASLWRTATVLLPL